VKRTNAVNNRIGLDFGRVVGKNEAAEALICGPQLDSKLGSDSNWLVWNALSPRVALSAP